MIPTGATFLVYDDRVCQWFFTFVDTHKTTEIREKQAFKLISDGAVKMDSASAQKADRMTNYANGYLDVYSVVTT